MPLKASINIFEERVRDARAGGPTRRTTKIGAGLVGGAGRAIASGAPGLAPHVKIGFCARPVHPTKGVQRINCLAGTKGPPAKISR